MTDKSKGQPRIIGIEGPAAAGTSTMATRISAEIGIPVVEGGKFYRQLTLLALRHTIEPGNTTELTELAKSMPVRFTQSSDGSTSLDGDDVSEALREDKVSKQVGKYAQNLDVRKIIDEQIAETIAKYDKVIIVGRHIKKLYPHASELHVTIDPEEAQRRHATRTQNNYATVANRDRVDEKTAQLLGSDEVRETAVDVTRLTSDEQTALLRQFNADAWSDLYLGYAHKFTRYPRATRP